MMNSIVIKINDFDFIYKDNALFPVENSPESIISEDQYSHWPSTVTILGRPFDRVEDIYVARLNTGSDWRQLHSDYFEFAYPQQYSEMAENGTLDEYLNKVNDKATILHAQLQAEWFDRIWHEPHIDKSYLYRSIVEAMRETDIRVEDEIVYQFNPHNHKHIHADTSCTPS